MPELFLHVDGTDTFRHLFTDKGLLWRLDVHFTKPDDPARRIALDNAVRTRFKNDSIHEESVTGKYGTIEKYRIVMTDKNILNEAVERYTSEYLAGTSPDMNF